MPTVSVYIRKKVYVKLVEEAERLGMGESELINKILEVYFDAKREKEVSSSPRQLLD